MNLSREAVKQNTLGYTQSQIISDRIQMSLETGHEFTATVAFKMWNIMCRTCTVSTWYSLRGYDTLGAAEFGE